MFWHCFADLDASRITGMEASPIQPSEVEAWWRLQGYTCCHLAEDLWTVVHRVDQHQMSTVREDQEKRKKDANARNRN